MPRTTDYGAVNDAYLAVKNGEMNLATASRLYGCSDRTVARRLSNKVGLHVMGPGPSPLFSEEQEWKLVDHLSKLASYGYGLTIQEVISLATDYAVCLKLRTADKPLTKRWFYAFMKRNPRLKLGKPQSLDVYRARASSKENVARYFANLKATMDDAGLADKPHLIYNVDEKGLTSQYSPHKVVFSKWTNCTEVTPPRRNLTTLIGCGNALGNSLPPYFVIAGSKVNNNFFQNSPPGTAATTSKTGWSNSVVFRQFLEEHFLKFVKPTPEEPVLLIYDGHKSHVNIDISDWAIANNIKLFVLPAHTSHFLQPLDVACFGPLESFFTSRKHRLMKNHKNGLLNCEEVCSLACKAYQDGLKPKNLVAGFRKTGIFPMVGIQAIPEDTFTPSIPFAPPRAQPEETEAVETQIEDTVVDM